MPYFAKDLTILAAVWVVVSWLILKSKNTKAIVINGTLQMIVMVVVLLLARPASDPVSNRSSAPLPDAVAFSPVPAAQSRSDSSASDSASLTIVRLATDKPTKKPKKVTYVLNTNTHKIHYPNCPSVRQMDKENKKDLFCTYAEIFQMSKYKKYKPCQRCNPH